LPTGIHYAANLTTSAVEVRPRSLEESEENFKQYPESEKP
jgi:hypothetical protein